MVDNDSRVVNPWKEAYFARKKNPSVICILNDQSTCLIILAIEMPYYRQIFSGSKIGALAARLWTLHSQKWSVPSVRGGKRYCDMPGSPCLSKKRIPGPMSCHCPEPRVGLLETAPRWHATIFSQDLEKPVQNLFPIQFQVLQSAVGMTHVLRCRLVMGCTN